MYALHIRPYLFNLRLAFDSHILLENAKFKRNYEEKSSRPTAALLPKLIEFESKESEGINYGLKESENYLREPWDFCALVLRFAINSIRIAENNREWE